MATGQWLNSELNTMKEQHEKGLLAERFRGYLPVIIDIETGGFNAETDALLEIAISLIDMNDMGKMSVTDTHAFDIEPFEGANLEQSALDFTGINPDDPLRFAIPEEDALREIFKIVRSEIKRHGCKRAILVAHNANFDYQFFTKALERTQIKRNPFHPFSTMDTATLAGFVYGHTVLATACQLAGIEHDNKQAHNAAYDANNTAELFCRMVNTWNEVGGWDKTLAAQKQLLERKQLQKMEQDSEE